MTPIRLRHAAPAALVLLTFASAARAEKFTERFERTYDTGAVVEVELGNTNGSVLVEAWDRDTVEVVAEKRVDAGNAADAREALEQIEIVVHERPGRLEIETRVPSAASGLVSWLFGRSRNADVRYELRVPRTAELDVHSVNGKVSTQGCGGRQRLASTNGRIEVAAARDGVEAHTTNGSIDVQIADASNEPDVELSSTNGGITLELPAGIGGRVDARTLNGSVKTGLPVTIDGGSSRRRLEGRINGGGASRIELSTTNGSIRINTSTGL